MAQEAQTNDTELTDVLSRFPRLRRTSVAVLCLYYYLSLFRQSSGILGFDVKLYARRLLTLFFTITLCYLLLNSSTVYAFYRHARLKFATIFVCVSLFTAITGQSWLLIPFLLYLLFADKSFDLLAKYLFTFSSVFFVAVIVASLIFPDLGRQVVDKSYSVASVFSTNANSLGFPNSNNLSLYLMVIVINGAFLIASRKRQKLYTLVMFLLATLVFKITLSITGYACICLFLFIYLLSSKRLLGLTRLAIPVIAILAIVLTPVVADTYGKDYRSFVNQSLSNRPYLWELRVSGGAYHNLLGNSDKFMSKDDEDTSGYTLDNQYLQIITRFGWVTLALFFYIYFVGIRKNNKTIIGGLFALAVYFIFESAMYILVLSIMPVLMIDSKIYPKPRELVGHKNV
jgi:hypothetical protein